MRIIVVPVRRIKLHMLVEQRTALKTTVSKKGRAGFLRVVDQLFQDSPRSGFLKKTWGKVQPIKREAGQGGQLANEKEPKEPKKGKRRRAAATFEEEQEEKERKEEIVVKSWAQVKTLRRKTVCTPSKKSTVRRGQF